MSIFNWRLKRAISTYLITIACSLADGMPVTVKGADWETCKGVWLWGFQQFKPTDVIVVDWEKRRVYLKHGK